MTTTGNKQMFEEMSKVHPNCKLIRRLLSSGQADINALDRRMDISVTAYWYMSGGVGKHRWNGSSIAVDTAAKLGAFKAHFYPLLDILEDYNFNIMNGSSFRPRADGSAHLQIHAGFRFLDIGEFSIMAKHDVPRLIQFFDRLYFSKGYSVDDTSATGIPYLSPLLWTTPESYKPELILYLIAKGARWNQPAWQQPGYEARITNFAAQVPAAKAAGMIVMLQKVLGINYALSRDGANLRGFLAAAYGTVGAVGILEKVVGLAGGVRRSHIIKAALYIPA